MRRFTTLLIALLVAATTLTIAPRAAAEEGLDVYTTPGIHLVNDRHWKTTCEE